MAAESVESSPVPTVAVGAGWRRAVHKTTGDVRFLSPGKTLHKTIPKERLADAEAAAVRARAHPPSEERVPTRKSPRTSNSGAPNTGSNPPASPNYSQQSQRSLTRSQTNSQLRGGKSLNVFGAPPPHFCLV